jgi:hypothetical protein
MRRRPPTRAALAQAPPAPDDAQPSGEGASAAAPAPAVADPAVALALPPAATARLPERIELGFDAYLESVAGDTRIGTARFELRLDGERYRMTIDARGPLATLAFGSEGVFAGDGFRPERFAERRRVAFRPTVDRGVRYVRAGDAPAAVDEASLAVPPGAQDRLSALFQLWLVARGRAGLPGARHRDRDAAGHDQQGARGALPRGRARALRGRRPRRGRGALHDGPRRRRADHRRLAGRRRGAPAARAALRRARPGGALRRHRRALRLGARSRMV